MSEISVCNLVRRELIVNGWMRQPVDLGVTPPSCNRASFCRDLFNSIDKRRKKRPPTGQRVGGRFRIVRPHAGCIRFPIADHSLGVPRRSTRWDETNAKMLKYKLLNYVCASGARCVTCLERERDSVIVQMFAQRDSSKSPFWDVELITELRVCVLVENDVSIMWIFH